MKEALQHNISEFTSAAIKHMEALTPATASATVWVDAHPRFSTLLKNTILAALTDKPSTATVLLNLKESRRESFLRMYLRFNEEEEKSEHEDLGSTGFGDGAASAST